MSNIDEIEFFRCEECKKLRPVSQMKEIRVKNVINPLLVCNECLKTIGGEKNDSKCSIGTDESSKGEDRKV